MGAVLSGVPSHDDPQVPEPPEVHVVLAGPGSSRWYTTRTPDLDLVVSTLDEFRSTEGERYPFAHARVLLDRLDGEIGQLVAAKGTLGRAETRTVLTAALEAYVNLAYQSAKNRHDGRLVAARLDAAESVPWLLTAVFAFHGRIRPYNRYLSWELTRYPLGTARWDGLVPMMERLLDGDVDAQRYLFAAVENEARGRGLGDVYRACGDDLALAR